MTGDLLVDGIDVYTEYGIIVQVNGYTGLTSYPPLKAIEFNDWPEEDGIDPDLADPKLNTRTFTIVFASSVIGASGDFINDISDESFHDFEFRNIGQSYRLRMVAQSTMRVVAGAEEFTLQFADDFPLRDYVYQEPIPSGQVTGYEIDRKDLSEYGISVREGVNEQLLSSPAVKQNLLVNTNGIEGAEYDGEVVFFKSMDVSILCNMKLPIETFWRNYKALLYNLTKPGQRIFYDDRRIEEFPCYYKKGSVSAFTVFDGEIWCDFEFTISFITFRVGEIDYLLAAENGSLFVTENGINFIDMQSYGNN